MYEVLSYILLATSILLTFLLFSLRKSKGALERELSLLKNRSPSEEIAELKAAALREIEELKTLERNRLEEELHQKRTKNDAEIAAKQVLIDKLLEDYKQSQKDALALSIEAERKAASELFTQTKQTYEDELFYLQGQLSLERAKVEQLRRNQIEITEALRRDALKQDEYNIRLSDADRTEVEDLRTIASKYVRIRPVILKAIYEIYYAPEVRKLVDRVVGPEKVMGVYRITSKVDGRVYIGKSVDIKERWVNHFKRAAGLETETQNLLYPEMRRQGIENFSFEVVEKVEDETLLSEREKYWQEFYDAKSHGFSVK